jgi:hypothetical protein
VWLLADLPARQRRAVQDAVAAKLPPPDDWYVHDEFITWVLRELLRPDARAAAWSGWIALTGREGSRIPWRCFLDAGHPATAVVDWGIDTMPERPRAAGPTMTPIKTTGGGVAVQVHEPTDAPQAAALDHLVASDDPAVLEALLHAPPEWHVPALNRLGRVAPERARRLILEQAVHAPRQMRNALLSSLIPAKGESEHWRLLADSETHWHDRLILLVQSTCVSDGDRWPEVSQVLDIVEALMKERSAAHARLEELCTPDEADDSRPSPSELAQAILVDLHGKVEPLLTGVCSALAHAPDPDEGLHELTHRIFGGPLRPSVRGAQSAWVLAWRLGGFDYVVDRLVVGHRDGERASVERLRACTNAGLFDELVRKLLLHRVLGRSATQVFAERIAPKHVDLIRGALDGQPLGNEAGVPDGATVALARKLAAVDAKGAVDWAIEAMAGEPVPVARSWWELLLPSLPPGDQRRRAVAAWWHLVAITA